jgi:hypothetical protein
MPARRSLFGPVFLIALGIALLWHNLNPQISLGQLFANYWPWILVAWGAFRLAEFAASRLIGRRPPEPLGGGAVLAAIFLCFAGSAAHSFLNSPFDFGDWTMGRGGWFDQEYDYLVRQEHSLEEGQSLLIRNLDGRIRIAASQQPGIRVAGRKRIRAFNDDEAARLDERTTLEISEQAQQLVVQTRPMPERDQRRLSYDVDIEIPAGTALQVEGSQGHLDIQGLTQSVTLHGSASIEIADVGGPVRIRARRSRDVIARRLGSTLEIDGRVRRIEAEDLAGTLTIDSNGVEHVRIAKLAQPARLRFNNTDVEFQNLAGEVEITSRLIEIEGAAGPLMVQSRGSREREIRLEKIEGALAVDAKRGNVTWIAGAKPGPAEVKIERGNIEVQLDADASFSIEAKTSRGNVSHEFGAMLQTEDRDRGATLSGGRGPLLKLQTGRGNLKIERTQGSAGHAVEI